LSEIGQGVGQGLIQILADGVGLSPERISLTLGDTSASPHGGGAWGSRGIAIGGEAALGAARKLKTEIVTTAGALLQADPTTLNVVDGWIVDAAGVARLSFKDLAEIVIFRGYELPDGLQPQLNVAHTFRREGDPAIPTNGIQASLVEIDAGTGIVRCVQHWVVEDCGVIVNPLLVDEQIRGGVVQGIGAALLEACRYDVAGQLLSGTLADYLLPMAAEMPDIIVDHVETPYSGSVLGAKGAGEAGTCAAAAAVLNAVNDALAPHDASISVTPITPESVLQALGTLPSERHP
jgi:carbon-monoxide dehydrogenase large subunit